MIGPDLLLAFVTVAECGSFTGAARVLGMRQSTVSQQIRRLEDLARRRLLARDTHRVALSTEGEAFLDHARRVLAAHGQMDAHLSGMRLRGRLRFGACEDFVLSALPDVLALFASRHPDVDVALTVGLSETLYDQFDAGQLDMVLVKKRKTERRGVTAWRETVGWVSRPDHRVEPGEPVPLLLYPPPSVTRALALDTLERERRTWRVAFTSGSLSGLTAAARAGLGVMPHSLRLIPQGLAPVRSHGDLPELPGIEFAVLGPGGNHPAAEALTAAILHWADVGASSSGFVP